MGPIRPAAYRSAYFLLALPNAFVATALMFSVAVLGRRSVASYLGGVFLFFAAVVSRQFVAGTLGHWGLAKLMDPFGLTVIGELSKVWTPGEKNTLIVGPQRSLLSNRLLWIGVALGVLALTYLRFRFAHVEGGGRKRAATKGEPAPGIREAASARSAPVAVPRVRRTFGFATRARQMLAVARESFQVIVRGWGGLRSPVWPAFVILIGPLYFQDEGVPLLPTTGQFVGVLEQAGEHGMWLVIPLLIVYYAGELVWREREARLSEIAGAAPVPEWVSFAGKFVGLALVLVAVQALMMAAAMLVQVLMGHYDFEIGLYARILFGIRAHRLSPLRPARPRRARRGEPEVRRTSRSSSSPTCSWPLARSWGSSTTCSSTGPIRAGRTRTCAASNRSSGRGSGSSSIGRRGRCCWRSRRRCSGCVARSGVSGRGSAWRAAASRAGRPRAPPLAAALVLTFGGFIFYNTNVLNA